ncbi:hypothetical protein N9R54_02680 [Pelobium sp.]|nr:hypothetical protein [Pelobium sp.]MDA9555120.1 hypothetical protein [Pelobium sp.]
MNKLKLIFFLGFIFCASGFLKAQELKDERLNEVSGLAVSSKSDDLLWVHNDSGDISRIFLINNSGETLATFNFHKQVIDCEDIAMYHQKNKQPEILVGDIGDNEAKRAYISIYKFLEPSLYLRSQEEFSVPKVKELKLQYPDGPRDAECLMADPIDQKIYIISKREDTVGVYSLPMNIDSDKILVLKKEGTLFFNAPKKAKWITAGDISADGHAIIIKSYINVYYWERLPGETLMQCLKRRAKILPYKPEPQGEAVGFTNDAKHYYTISEGKNAIVHFKGVEVK